MRKEPDGALMAAVAAGQAVRSLGEALRAESGAPLPVYGMTLWRLGSCVGPWANDLSVEGNMAEQVLSQFPREAAAPEGFGPLPSAAADVRGYLRRASVHAEAAKEQTRAAHTQLLLLLKRDAGADDSIGDSRMVRLAARAGAAVTEFEDELVAASIQSRKGSRPRTTCPC
jgi:hypothetical protein